MDPFFTSVAAGALANVLSDSTKNTVAYWSSLPSRDESFASGLILQDDSGDQVLLSAAQLRDLDLFLKQTSVLSIAAGLVMVLPALREGAEDVADELKRVFIGQAQEWCSINRSSWLDASEIVWNRLLQYLIGILPGRALLERLSEDDYSALLGAPEAAFLQGHEAALPAASRDLLEISCDADRLVKARNTVADIRRSAAETYAEMWLQHLYDDRRFDYRDLYVSRSLRSTSGPTPDLPQDALGDVDRSHRLVIIGDPGVGKSTLVRRFVYTTASTDALNRAPMLVRVRDIPIKSASPLLDDVARLVANQLTISLTGDELSDVLALGRAIVIFDGIDEIPDIANRREFIRLVEGFARRYPLSQVIATSRRVGYVRARFATSLFDVYELNEYDSGQVSEYVQRWFGLSDQPAEDAASFLRESGQIEDVRRNPLMLSLLCTLYRARGYLPTNRRTVYGECASLLFLRWDSMRHVEQPYDHRQYGERLMQELAYFFYKTPSAVAGVDEVVLKKLVANFFVDTTGVEELEAERRAREFVEFCADRAWLLSAKGTSRHGARLFAFTHQTFLEYFAAEAIVRKAQSRSETVAGVREAYTRSPGSLISELMIQAAEYKYENAAEELVRDLLGSRRSAIGALTLCLRIANATPLRRLTLDRLYEHLFSQWETADPDDSHSEILALLEMYRDPMARFREALRVGDWLEGGRVSAELLGFCRRYARLALIGDSRVFDPEWRDTCVSVLQKSRSSWGEPAVAHFLAGAGVVGADDVLFGLHRDDLLALRVFGQPTLGAPLQHIDAVARGEQPDTGSRMLELVATKVLPVLTVSVSSATTILESTSRSVAGWLPAAAFNWSAAGRPRHVRDILLWLRCVLAEATYDKPHPLGTRDDLLVDPTMFAALVHERRGGGATEVGSSAISRLPDPPGWLRAWARNSLNIVRFDPHRDFKPGLIERR